ncbi:class I SAM-dependent methyltransferase [Rhizobium rhizoryzae]|uniref:class I SAM-dependent methyltransferase n=1 Tax=Rhizobium rhizoryzae TaxID=451876 RepID=UPI0028986230|nr:class I SAM-dependent methyltransferase [Rhizobium rhizoryzae]
MTSASWSAGYVTDINYTHGYYQDLNPGRARLALLQAGYSVSDTLTACELGFGQGVSIAMHSAAMNAQWSGTDFNPSQAMHAQKLAAAAGVDTKLHDEAFDEFCHRSDLPDFDYIGLHGIWSWISDKNRAVIVDFLRRKLKVGGIVYISYNTQPGWAAAAPLRHLMTEAAASLLPTTSGSVARAEGALDFVDKLLATEPAYLRANPQVKERFEKLKKDNPSYLAHEYFNRDWHPMYFADMARWLEAAKLTFAASVNLLDHVASINLSPLQQQLLSQLSDRIMRETARDFCINQQFRRDLWIKGGLKLNELEQAEALRAQRFLMVTPRAKAAMAITGPLGTANLSEVVYTPLLDLMADHKVRTIGEMESALKGKVTLGQLVQAAMILTGMSTFTPAQEAGVVSKVKKRTERLNQHLMEQARTRAEIMYLASPVTGGGIPLTRVPQLICLAIKLGKKTPADWADYVFQILQAQGQKILKDGKPIESDDENKAELLRQAQEFGAEHLPILRALEVV